MTKSIGTQAHIRLLACLREMRETAGLTQTDLAKRLCQTQSFVSKCERGERRLDLVELRQFCLAAGTTLDKFVKCFERKL